MPGIVRTMMTKSGIAIRYIESDEMIREIFGFTISWGAIN